MKNKFNPLVFVKQLSALGERQGKTAERAATLIKQTLKDFGVTYSVEKSNSFIPKTISARLVADGKNIPCEATAFKSGVVTGKENFVSSLIPSRFLINRENINFNPLCAGISRSNFYFAPSVAINRNNLPQIMNAKNICATVSVKKIPINDQQILVGSIKKPHTIVFGHYDSIGPGAIDNASGVSVLIGTILKNPLCLNRTLFVFDGNEELSFDNPTYWGKGFRTFEARHKAMLELAKRIIVVDCVGNGPANYGRNKSISYLAFPVINVEKWSGKIFNLSGDIGKLMPVYHSNLDTPRLLKSHFLDSTIELLSKKLLN